ncbi:MAG TPA: fatty acid--CoA ligase family protein [Candidatus Polarisedimenticolia bacterium]|jgi:acyl-CoA synthetase (AMP-forming)/AMP-acid ligase II|nr:fatty acid--CoA ligase family protein [Candidatus Polarisedimenticolia bacterium]
MTGLAASPRRDAARFLPAGRAFDVDSFERLVLGAERRLVRAGTASGRQVAEPDSGQLVLLSCRNIDAYLVAIATLWKRGFVPLLADADLAREEVSRLVRAFRPGFCLFDRRVDPEGGETEPLGDSLPGLHAWIPPRRGARPDDGRDGARPDGRPGAAIVRLTSGTTGRPRGIVVTADQLLADAEHIARTVGIRPNDTLVTAIPLGHAYGFTHVLMMLVLQGTRPILLEQPLPALLVEALSSPGPLVMPATPYLFQLLLQSAGRKSFKGLRLCVSAGALLPEELSRAFKERFGLPLRTFYGASECGGISYDRSREGIVGDGWVGTPLDGVEVTVRPERGHEEGTGRVCVRSAAVAECYYPEDGTDLEPGRFLTSDLGRIDAEGRIRIVGRVDRMINVGGRKVNPAEVESVLRAVPGVRQAVVLGVPDRHRGQAVCACIVGARGLTREALLAACAVRLAPFKVPRHIELLDRIPTNARGKTEYRALVSAVLPVRQRAARPTLHRN